MASKPEESPIDLGFAEDCEPWLLTNRYFPSKIGGQPAWLDLKNLPKTDTVACPKCKQPRVFLCQVYSPIEDSANCFHRTVFVFICRNEECNAPNSSENILVLRSQLQQVNEFYSAEAPSEDEEHPAIPSPVKLCAVCGCRGPLACARCKNITYCSASHQRADWKHHKTVCSTENKDSKSEPSEFLFTELELVIEPETVAASQQKEETEEEAEARRLKEFEALSAEGNLGELKDVPDSELAQYAQTAEETASDKQFRKFKKRIQSEPTQVLRYDRNGQPLWITDGPATEIEIPKCEKCGQERNFEFQIMPQLLNELQEDKLDWGVIAVYTCKDSCSIEGYVKEFVVKQDILNDDAE